MALLTAKWTANDQRYQSYLNGTHTDIGDRHAHLAATQSMAETILTKQSVDTKQACEEFEGQIAADMRGLEERRQEKALALERVVGQSEQLLRETSENAKKQLEMQRSAAQVMYSNRARMAAARCENTVLKEHQSVDAARRSRSQWQRKASQMRESFRAHAIKSGSYVKSLDPQRKEQLLHIWSTG